MPDIVAADDKAAAPVAGDIEASENERDIRFHAQEAQRFMVLANQATQKISGAAQTALECAIAAGVHLLAAKKLLPHGRWEKWIISYFGASARTARIYMSIAKHCGPLGNVRVDGPQSIQSALNAIAKNKQELGPREVIGCNEWMQHAKHAKYQLGQNIKDAFVRNIDNEFSVFLWLGPGRAVWDELLEEKMGSFVKELRKRSGDSYEVWHAKRLKERAVERAEHCHRKIEELENRKNDLTSQITVGKPCDGAEASCLEEQRKNVEKAIVMWTDMLAESEADIDGQHCSGGAF